MTNNESTLATTKQRKTKVNAHRGLYASFGHCASTNRNMSVEKPDSGSVVM